MGDYTATIDWGDGTTSTGTVVHTAGINFQVNAPSHTYVDEGTYTVSATVQHDGLAALTSNTQSITIADQQLANLVSANLSANGVEGAGIGAITGIATFTDPAGAGAETLAGFIATINWGDSTTSPGTIVSLGGGNYRVDAPAHTYAEENSYTVNVTLKHDALGSLTTPDQTIVIGDPAVVLTPAPFAATQNVSFTGKTVATFTDPGGAELVAGCPIRTSTAPPSIGVTAPPPRPAPSRTVREPSASMAITPTPTRARTWPPLPSATAARPTPRPQRS